MNDDKSGKVVIFESEMLGTIFEIKSRLPSWDLTKYIMAHYGEFTQEKVSGETAETFNEIISKCFIAWRNGDQGAWNTEFNALPGAVVMSYLTALMTQAQIKVATTIKTEKNL